MGYRRFMLLVVGVSLVSFNPNPSQAKVKRPTSKEALVIPALKAIQKADISAYRRLAYSPSDGVRLCPKFAKTRGWEAGSPRLPKFDKRIKRLIGEAIKSCAGMGDWKQSELLHIKGGVTETRIPLCEKSEAYRVDEFKGLFRMGTTFVEVTLRHPGKINGAYGFMNPPLCRVVKATDWDWKAVLDMGSPCTLSRAGTSGDRSWRPSADPKETNQVRGRHTICSKTSKVAGIYGPIRSQFRKTFRTLQLEKATLKPVGRDDQRVVMLDGKYLAVMYNDCWRCKGYRGWSFFGRVDWMPDEELKALQKLLGLPASVPPMRTTTAWSSYYKNKK